MKLAVPTVLQADDYSCGAACLEMVLRFHGRPVPRDLRRLCNPQDGLQPGGLTAMLQREFGHYASFRMTPGILRGFIRDGKPVVCPIMQPEWLTSHWVVVVGVTPRGFCAVCPIDGPIFVHRVDWMACWRDELPASPWHRWGVTSWPDP